MRDPANARRARAETAAVRRTVITQLAAQDLERGYGFAKRVYRRLPDDIRPSLRTVQSVLRMLRVQSAGERA